MFSRTHVWISPKLIPHAPSPTYAMAGRSGAATFAPTTVGNAEPQLPKLSAASIERGRLKRRYEFDTEQMLPMSVDTITPSGIALSSSRSICRGCMWVEFFDTSSDHESFSCAHPSSSASHAFFASAISARRDSLL